MRRISVQFLAFRRKNNYSQEELGRLMGVSERTVRNVEKGSFGISLTVILKFRDVKRLFAENKKAGRAMRIPR